LGKGYSSEPKAAFGLAYQVFNFNGVGGATAHAQLTGQMAVRTLSNANDGVVEVFGVHTRSDRKLK
jgi:hypothetical protein